MRMRSLILLLLLVPLSGCIVTYRDFPNATLESLPKNHEPKPFSYHVEPILTRDESGGGMSRLGAVAGIILLPGFYAAVPQVDPIGEPGYHEVARTLKASGMFSDMIEAPAEVPETGVYCYVNFEVSVRSPGLKNFAEAAHFLPLLPILITQSIPYYAGEGGTTVVYALYRDGQLKQTYRYPITKKGAGWIVLLPFAWLNFFTNDLKDAVRGATLQFLIDAQRDGNL